VPEVGAEWTDSGFVSTSTRQKLDVRAGEVSMRITVPAGTRAVAASELDVNEILLDRGMTFKITKVTGDVRSGWHVEAEVVPKVEKAAKVTARKAPSFSAPEVDALPRIERKFTVRDAAAQTNPEYGTTTYGPKYRGVERWTPDLGPLPSGAYEENCTNAVYGFEMRMRGFDVQAAPLDVLDRHGYAAGRTYQEVDDLLTAGWRLPDGRPHGRSFSAQAWRSFKEIDAEIVADWPEGGRGFITVGKHVFNVIKKSGKPVYVEAQFDASATRAVTAQYRKKYGLGAGMTGEAKVVRLDDLVPTDSIMEAIAK
jgi:hypothetical protein